MTNELAVQEDQSTGFLYDFLYVDTPRVSGFLSHFQNDGILTSIKKTESEDSSTGRDNKANLASIFTSTTKSQKLHKASYEHSFDPSLLLPITAIETLSEAGYIHNDIHQCGLGQLVLMPGKLSLTDFRMMKNLWDVVIRLGIEQDTADMSPKQKKLVIDQIKKKFSEIKTFIEAMPHALTAHFFSEDTQVFSVLDTNHLRIPAETLALSHGSTVAGSWFILGLVDAIPDYLIREYEDSHTHPHPLIDGMQKIATGARELLGRPEGAYAVTPVAIFRTVTPSGLRV